MLDIAPKIMPSGQCSGRTMRFEVQIDLVVSSYWPKPLQAKLSITCVGGR